MSYRTLFWSSWNRNNGRLGGKCSRVGYKIAEWDYADQATPLTEWSRANVKTAIKSADHPKFYIQKTFVLGSDFEGKQKLNENKIRE